MSTSDDFNAKLQDRMDDLHETVKQDIQNLKNSPAYKDLEWYPMFKYYVDSLIIDAEHLMTRDRTLHAFIKEQDEQIVRLIDQLYPKK